MRSLDGGIPINRLLCSFSLCYERDRSTLAGLQLEHLEPGDGHLPDCASCCCQSAVGTLLLLLIKENEVMRRILERISGTNDNTRAVPEP